MSTFRRVELWTDVECNAGTRLVSFERYHLAQCTASFSLTGDEKLVVAVPRNHPNVGELRVGRVLRVDCTDTFDEWRIAELHDAGGEGATVSVATANPIALDLARALYTAYDAEGAPSHRVTLADTTLTDLVDGPVRDALDAAGLDWIVTGTIEPTATFDLDVDDAGALSLLAEARAEGRAPGDLRVIRNGTTDYEIHCLDEYGSDAPVAHVRTARALVSTQRTFKGSDLITRAGARGREDGTHRGLAFAYWEVTARDTGADWLELSDPRGGGNPSPIRFDDQLNGYYVGRVSPTFTAALISDTVASSSRVYVPDASLFTVGDWVQLFQGNTSGSPRLAWLDYPAAQTAYAGVTHKIVDRPALSGAVNLAPNPYVTAFDGTIRMNCTLGNGGQATWSTSSDIVTGSGTSFTSGVSVGDRIYRASDNTLVGTVESVDSTTQLTLTANAAITDAAAVDFDIVKDAPTGAVAAATGSLNPYLLTEQVTSSVDLTPAASAWRIRRTFGSGSAYTPGLYFTPVAVDTARAWRVWVWVEVTTMPVGASCTVDLFRADTFAAIAGVDAVTLDDTDAGTTVVVEFVAPDISAATAGVVIGLSFVNTFDVTVGPWGCAPAAWERFDTATPHACDLWHSVNDFLASSALPVAYRVTLADLEALDGDRFAADALTLGGTIQITDTDLNVTTTQRIVELTRDYLRPLATQLQLGERGTTLAEQLAAANRTTIVERPVDLAGVATALIEAGTIAGDTTTVNVGQILLGSLQ